MLAGQSALKCHQQTLWLTISQIMFIFVCDVHVLCESSRLQKPSKLPQKASKRLQKPSNAYKSQKLGHFVFPCFRQYAKKMEILSLLLLFCRVLTELCFWKKHGHDCKFEHCACVCTSPCGLGCTTYFVRDHLKPGFFHERNL